MTEAAGGGRAGGGAQALLVPGLLIAHLALTLFLAARLNVWIDEAFTLRSTGDGLAHAVHRALLFEGQPPLYFIVLTFWRKLSHSVLNARLLSVLCVGLALPVTAALARRLAPTLHPAWAVAAVAFNPLAVYAAVEIRLYAPVVLLSGLLLLTFHDGFLAEDEAQGTRRARRAHTVLALAALATHYFLGFLLVGEGAALLALRRWAALRRHVLSMVLVGVLFLPLAYVAASQLAMVSSSSGVGGGWHPLAALRSAWGTLWGFLFPTGGVEGLGMARKWISRLGLPLLALAALGGAAGPGRWRRALPAVVLAGTGGLLFAAVGGLLGPRFMRPHHASALLLPTCLAALALLSAARPSLARGTVAAAVVLFQVPVLGVTYAPLAKPGDFSRVAEFIQDRERPNEPILVFKSESVLPLGVHYRGANKLAPLPVPPDEERYDLGRQVLHGREEVAAALGAVRPGGRFWVVTRHTEPFRGVDFHPEVLEGFLGERTELLLDREFFSCRVRLLRLRPEAGEGS